MGEAGDHMLQSGKMLIKINVSLNFDSVVSRGNSSQEVFALPVLQHLLYITD